MDTIFLNNPWFKLTLILPQKSIPSGFFGLNSWYFFEEMASRAGTWQQWMVSVVMVLTVGEGGEPGKGGDGDIHAVPLSF